jgi:hypothetical protein
MATFIVLAPPVSASGGAGDADRMVFVRDGFSWGAFLISLPWLLYRRQWIALCFYALFVVGIDFATRQFGGSTAAALGLLGSLFLGFEGNALRRWSFVRRGFVEQGVVEASSRDEAEIRYFHGRDDETGFAPSTGAPFHRFTRTDTPAEIIGLFPTPGTTR